MSYAPNAPDGSDTSAADFLAMVAEEMDQVDPALRRLDTDAAQVCQTCGTEIGRSELIADPLRTRCGVHQAG